MALNAEAMQGIFDENNKRRKIQDIPAYYGNAKDKITGRQFIEKIEAAATVALPEWNDARKLIEIEHCLQGLALKWFVANKHTRPNFNAWATVKAAFLVKYDPEATTTSMGVTLTQLYCRADEKVSDFYARVDENFHTLIELLPTRCKTYTEAADATAWAALATAEARTAANEALPGKLREGFQWLQMSMFIHGLPHRIRKEVQRQDPTNLIDAHDYAHTAELRDKKESQRINALEEDDDDVAEEELEDEEHLNAINFYRKRKGLPPRPRPAHWAKPQAAANPAGGLARKAPFDLANVKCRYKPCGQKGHMQRDCPKRLRDKAPCVDKDGKPYTSQLRGKVNDVTEEEDVKIASAHLNGLRFA